MVQKKPTKSKASASNETSESIAAQTEAFLEAGGKVEVISKGVSGQEATNNKKPIASAK